jgi:hypothetical protein
MQHIKWQAILVGLVMWKTLSGFAQESLRGVLTTGFGDVALIKQKAELGHAESQVAYADTLVHNFKCSEGLQWYLKAANQGNIQAIYEVGNMLLFGRIGIPQENTVQPRPAKGIRWTFQAATNGHAKACWNMSTALQRGLGVSTNLVEAYAWLQLFAESIGGSIVGRAELNRMALTLDTTSIQQAQRLVAQFKSGHFQRPVIRAIPEGDNKLKLNGVTAGGKRPFAIINGKTLAEGESAKVPAKPNPLVVKCLKIERDAVLIVIDGEEAPRLLRVK